MKKVIIYCLIFAVSASSFGQKTSDSIPSVKKDYLHRSKNQKTAGWILLGGGAALMGSGFVVGIAEVASFDDAATGAVLIGVGFLSSLASIPLFIASGKNKKKAMNMTTTIKMEKAASIERQSFVQSSYPALAFKINL